MSLTFSVLIDPTIWYLSWKSTETRVLLYVLNYSIKEAWKYREPTSFDGESHTKTKMAGADHQRPLPHHRQLQSSISSISCSSRGRNQNYFQRKGLFARMGGALFLQICYVQSKSMKFPVGSNSTLPLHMEPLPLNSVFEVPFRIFAITTKICAAVAPPGLDLIYTIFFSSTSLTFCVLGPMFCQSVL